MYARALTLPRRQSSHKQDMDRTKKGFNPGGHRETLMEQVSQVFDVTFTGGKKLT